MNQALSAAFAACAALMTAPAQAQELAGPENAWIGIDNLEITYSGGTALFDLRFDRRAFNEVFGPGEPDMPFTSEADIGSAFTAIADFFNSMSVRQSQLRPVVSVPGDQDVVDNIYLPVMLTADTVVGVYNVDDGGPTGWRFDPAFDVFEGTSFDRTLDMAQQNGQDAAWAVFTLVETPCQADLFPPNNGDGVLNFFDLGEYLNLFGAMDPAADLFPVAAPDGVFNFFDLGEYLNVFGQGCP